MTLIYNTKNKKTKKDKEIKIKTQDIIKWISEDYLISIENAFYNLYDIPEKEFESNLEKVYPIILAVSQEMPKYIKKMLS